MSDALWDGRRFRTFNVIDDFSREALAIDIDLNLPAARVIRTLERIAAWRGYPTKLRLDNGPEFVVLALAEWAERKGIALDFIEPGRPMQNGFIERFNGSYRRGVLDMHVFRTLSEVREHVTALYARIAAPQWRRQTGRLSRRWDAAIRAYSAAPTS